MELIGNYKINMKSHLVKPFDPDRQIMFSVSQMCARLIRQILFSTHLKKPFRTDA